MRVYLIDIQSRCAQSDESLILEGTTWCISVEIHKYVVARLRSDLTSPVMLSTLEDGKIVADLSGIPSEGPVLYVGYHNLLGLEAFPMVQQFMIQRNVLVRCVAHPMFFESKDGGLPDFEGNDTLRIIGGVPASAVNLYKLLSSKSHVMLHPGGMREALHRKVCTF